MSLSSPSAFGSSEGESEVSAAKRPSNRARKSTVNTSNTPSKKIISKKTKSNKAPADQGKPKAKRNKTGNEKRETPPDSDDDPAASYKKGLDDFQQYMEGKLKEIMTSDKIYKPDADRIMKKFHSALVKERIEMNKIAETYGHKPLVYYDSDENREENRKIENEYRELDEILKQQRKEEEMLQNEFVEEEASEITRKSTKKKNERGTGDTNTKDHHLHRSTRSTMQSVSTPLWNDSTKTHGKPKDNKSNTSTFTTKRESAQKFPNSRQEMNMGNKKKHTTYEKLLNTFKHTSTEESSDSDFLLNKNDKTKERIGMKTSGKYNNEQFQNKKTVEEKERQDTLMNILGDEKIRRAYLKECRQRKKTPIFR